MRHCASFAALLVIASACAASAVSAGVGVRLGGSLSYVSYGDFNDLAGYLNDEVLAPSGATGEMSLIHWIPEFHGEIVMSVVPKLDLGVGAGIIKGESEFNLIAAGDRFDYRHVVEAYPITATAYAQLPPLPFAKPYAFGGAGVYYAKLSFDESLTLGGSESGVTAELAKWGFGLHGGVGLSFSLAPKVTFDIGVKGRWARIKGFEGTATSTDGETVDVFLASYIDEDGGCNFGPEAAADKGALAEGAVDLSGFAFTLTLTIAR